MGCRRSWLLYLSQLFFVQDEQRGRVRENHDITSTRVLKLKEGNRERERKAPMNAQRGGCATKKRRKGGPTRDERDARARLVLCLRHWHQNPERGRFFRWLDDPRISQSYERTLRRANVKKREGTDPTRQGTKRTGEGQRTT